MAVTSGTYANIPGSPSSGDLHFLTDSFYDVVYYNGSNSPASWDHLLHGKLLTVPPSFSWINQGGASVSTTNGGEALVCPSNGGSDNCRIRKRTAPSTPYVLTAALLPSLVGVNYIYSGVLFRESSTGKLITFNFTYNNGAFIKIITWNSPSAGVANLFSMASAILASSPLIYFRLEDDGTNRKYHFSGDGMNFVELYSEGRTTFLTADELGWFASPYNNPANIALIHWNEA